MQDNDKERAAVIAYNTFLIKHGQRGRVGRQQFINEFKRSLYINAHDLWEHITEQERQERGASAKKSYLSAIITYNRYIVKSGCECNGGDFKINMRRD